MDRANEGRQPSTATRSKMKPHLDMGAHAQTMNDVAKAFYGSRKPHAHQNATFLTFRTPVVIAVAFRWPPWWCSNAIMKSEYRRFIRGQN